MCVCERECECDIFWTFYLSKNSGGGGGGGPQNINQPKCFQIDNNMKYFLSTISILELFLKDHVTLKTGILMLKIQLSRYTGIQERGDEDRNKQGI